MTTSGDLPRVITIPSSDQAFSQHVSRLVADRAAGGPGDLQERLRRLFPRVIVRERQLSGEPTTWYVYRDGRWRASDDGPWWQQPGLATVKVSLDGFIVEANAMALSLFGIEANELGLRHFTDFTPPGTRIDAEAMFEIVAAGRPLDGTIVTNPTSGDLIALDQHAVPGPDGIQLTLRLAEDVDVGPPVFDAAPRPPLATLPPRDVAFAAYARQALARIPEPTADGLALRLRRLYPHARVEVDGERWIARRDNESAARSSSPGWWQDESLPRVRYDEQALILEANDAARQLLGRELVGHHWQEFVTPGSTEEVAAMLAILAEAGEAESRFRIPTAAGSLLEFDSFTKLDGETFTTTMRPRT